MAYTKSLKSIIQDITHSLIAFPAYVISYYPRKGNKAAGKIANETFSFTNNVPNPSCILLVSPWVKSFMEADKPCVRMLGKRKLMLSNQNQKKKRKTTVNGCKIADHLTRES